MNKNFQKKSGFTLVELLIVISIIMILVTVGMMSYANAQKVGRDAKRKADLKQVQSALEMFRADNGFYPKDTSGNISSTLAGPLATSPKIYIQILPSDPNKTTYNYYYSNADGGVTYKLCSALENLNDPDKDASCGNNCGGQCNYVVYNP